MTKLWMVRAGERSVFASEFERQNAVGIGWDRAGDLTDIHDLDEMRRRIGDSYPGSTPQARATSAAQAFKFRSVIQPGDRVVTYDGEQREYLLGTITGDYRYEPGVFEKFKHVRPVAWDGRIPKDVLRQRSNNSLGAILTLFDPGPDVLADLEDALRSGRTVPPAGSEEAKDDTEDFEELFAEFEETFLSTEKGLNHRRKYAEGAARGRRNYDAILRDKAAGVDVTDAVLRNLLPHIDSVAHREGGEWIHVAPAVNKDVRSWFEGAGWAKPSDWPRKAAAILDFVQRAVEHPDQLEDACTQFSASAWSTGLQSGMLTPILNSLRPDAFCIVNSKVLKTLRALTGKRYKASLADYPSVNAVVKDFAREHHAQLSSSEAHELSPETVFDMFSHWYVAEREDDPSEDDGEVEEPVRLRRSNLDRSSTDHARRVIEMLCPDAAPRYTATAYFAEFVKKAHALSPTAWSVTLKPALVRLNVGGIVVVDLRRDGLYLAIDESAIPASALESISSFDRGEDWRYIEGVDGYLLPYSSLEPALSLLRAANESVLRKATQKSDRAPFRSAHSPAVLTYLREKGFDVPDPEYVRPIPTEPVVGEAPTPGYAPQQTYSLEACASETMLPETTVKKWIEAIHRKGQAILFGPPGTGKTFLAERLARHLVGGGDGIRELVQFHPAYAYEDFIQGLRPAADDKKQLEYRLEPGRFIQFCRRAGERSGLSVLIIDEINRANLAQVFGELMYLLEYRDQDIPLAAGGRLRIPPNVRIIGTMNTADRSIALVDHALRRRFAFIRLDPDLGILDRYHTQRGLEVSGLINVIKQVNDTIANPHYSVGISFFMRERLHDHLEAVWIHEIEPYLEEYFFDRPKTVDSFRWGAIQEQVLG